MNQSAHNEMPVVRGFKTPEQAPPMAPTPDSAPETMPEVAREQEPIQVEQDERFLDETIGTLKQALKKKPKQTPAMPQVRDQMTVRVEHIMEHGLADAFRSMTPIQQQQFKMKGEETALKIRDALQKTKIRIKDVFGLLIEWLKMLPGVNKFYIEQEAKIKAEKIIALRHFDDIDAL